MLAILRVVAPILEARAVTKPILALALGTIAVLALSLRPIGLLAIAVSAVAMGLAIEPFAPLTSVRIPVLAIELPILALPFTAILKAILAIAKTTLIVVVPLRAVLLTFVGTLALRALHRLIVREARDNGLVAVPEIISAATLVASNIVVDRVACQPHTGVHVAAGGAAGHFAALLHLLLAVGENDAIIVLSMLEIILRQHGVAGRLGVASERDVFLGNVGRGAPNLHIRTVRLETARQRILTLADIVGIRISAIVRVTAAATSMLLSLPHGLPFSR